MKLTASVLKKLIVETMEEESGEAEKLVAFFEDPKDWETIIMAIEMATTLGIEQEVLDALDSSIKFDMQYSAGFNGDLPTEIVDFLSKDENVKLLQFGMLSNKNLSEERMRELASIEVNRYTIEYFIHLAENPSLPEDLMLRFSDIRSELVLAHLAKNPSTPQRIIMKIASEMIPEQTYLADKLSQNKFMKMRQ